VSSGYNSSRLILKKMFKVQFPSIDTYCMWENDDWRLAAIFYCDGGYEQLISNGGRFKPGFC
jgi:hypothetical protein